MTQEAAGAMPCVLCRSSAFSLLDFAAHFSVFLVFFRLIARFQLQEELLVFQDYRIARGHFEGFGIEPFGLLEVPGGFGGDGQIVEQGGCRSVCLQLALPAVCGYLPEPLLDHFDAETDFSVFYGRSASGEKCCDNDDG